MVMQKSDFEDPSGKSFDFFFFEDPSEKNLGCSAEKREQKKLGESYKFCIVDDNLGQQQKRE